MPDYAFKQQFGNILIFCSTYSQDCVEALPDQMFLWQIEAAIQIVCAACKELGLEPPVEELIVATPADPWVSFAMDNSTNFAFVQNYLSAIAREWAVRHKTAYWRAAKLTGHKQVTVASSGKWRRTFVYEKPAPPGSGPILRDDNNHQAWRKWLFENMPDGATYTGRQPPAWLPFLLKSTGGSIKEDRVQ